MSEHAGLNFEITFSDLTLLEANGEHEEVKRLMESPEIGPGGQKNPPPTDKWVLKSNIIITHQFGEANIICDFYYDKNIIITEYWPSTQDIYNPDIRCLTHWAYAGDWNPPKPRQKVIEELPDFWRMQWEVRLIDSEYFDDKFGVRDQEAHDLKEGDDRNNDGNISEINTG